MSVDSEMARLRRPYTRFARRVINRTALGAVAGAAAGVIGGTLCVAGGIWLLTFARWADARGGTPEDAATLEGMAPGGALDAALAVADRGAALLAFATIPFTLVGYGLVLGTLLGMAHGLVVRTGARSGPLELIAAATGAAVGWQIAGPWLAAVPPLVERARFATAVAIAAAALGSAIGGALFAAIRARPRRGDLVPDEAREGARKRRRSDNRASSSKRGR